MTSSSARSLAVAAACGALWGAGFWPGGFGLLAWAALAPLLWTVRGLRPGAAFVWGWTFGTCAWLTGVNWLTACIVHGLNIPAPAAFGVAAAICAQSGLMYGLFAWGLAAAEGPYQLLLAVPLFAALERYFPSMFPVPLAETQCFWLPLVQSADVFGAGGLCWLVVGANAALVHTLRPGRSARWTPLAVVAALVAADAGYGFWRIAEVDAAVARRRAEGGVVRVGALQGGVPAAERFVPERLERNVALYGGLARRLLAEGPVDLLLWPENSYERPVSFDADDAGLERPRFERPLASDMPAHAGATLIGAMAARGASRYYVSLLAAPDLSIQGVTGKRDRTPLTEFIPFAGQSSRLARMAPWLIARGPHRLLRLADGTPFGVYICYEAIVDASAREYARDGARFLINQSNNDEADGWIMVGQMTVLGALRAIENRRFVVRPSAYSSVIDPVGRVSRPLAQGRAGVFTAEIPTLDGWTPFMTLGGLLYAFSALVCAAAALGRTR